MDLLAGFEQSEVRLAHTVLDDWLSGATVQFVIECDTSSTKAIVLPEVDRHVVLGCLSE